MAERLSRREQLVGIRLKAVKESERRLERLNDEIEKADETVNEAREAKEKAERSLNEAAEALRKLREERLPKENETYAENKKLFESTQRTVLIHDSATLKDLKPYNEAEFQMTVEDMKELENHFDSDILVNGLQEFSTKVRTTSRFQVLNKEEQENIVAYVAMAWAMINSIKKGEIKKKAFLVYRDELITELLVANGIPENEIPRG